MKNRDFEYVNAISQKGSFSKAAQTLFISQPALSAAIKKIENDLHGVPLFNRGVNPITLTPAGAFYLEAAEKITAIEESIQAYFSAAAGTHSGTLNMGSSSYFCTYVLPDIIDHYTQKNPGIVINLVENGISELEEKLKSGILDLIVDVSTLDPQIFDSVSLGKEHILLAVPSSFEINHQLTSYRLSYEQIRDVGFLSEAIPAVPLSMLANEPFLLLKKQHDLYKRGMELCHHAGFEPKVILYLDQLLTAYHIAKTGKGITFFRNTLLDHTDPTEDLVYYKLGNKPAVREIWASCKKYPEPSPLTDDFMKYMMLYGKHCGGREECR